VMPRGCWTLAAIWLLVAFVWCETGIDDIQNPCEAQWNITDFSQPALLHTAGFESEDRNFWAQALLDQAQDQWLQTAHPAYVVLSEGVPEEEMKLTKVYLTLSTLKEKTPWVTFGASFPLRSPYLRQAIKSPGVLRPHMNLSNPTRPIFSLGADSSGLPFHSHGAAWFQLLYGVKEWFLYKPGHMPRKVQKQWASPNQQWQTAAAQAPEQKPLHCLQMPGQVMYVPAGWLHSTLNRGECLGVGEQESPDVDEYLPLMENVLKHNPNDADALNYLGIIAARATGDVKEAEKYFLAALDSIPCLAESVFHLAELYTEQQREEDALQILENFAEDCETFPPKMLQASIAFKAGLLALRADSSDQLGQSFLEDAVRAQPENKLYRYWLARAVVEAGDENRGTGILKRLLNKTAEISPHLLSDIQEAILRFQKDKLESILQTDLVDAGGTQKVGSKEQGVKEGGPIQKEGGGKEEGETEDPDVVPTDSHTRRCAGKS